jgi:hypothetical protein
MLLKKIVISKKTEKCYLDYNTSNLLVTICGFIVHAGFQQEKTSLPIDHDLREKIWLSKEQKKLTKRICQP